MTTMDIIYECHAFTVKCSDCNKKNKTYNNSNKNKKYLTTHNICDEHKLKKWLHSCNCKRGGKSRHHI